MIKTTKEAIKEFKDHYGQEIAKGIEKVSLEQMRDIATALETAVKTPRNTIYVFGNGGSYAIGKHFELALKSEFRDSQYGLRVSAGVDAYGSQEIATSRGYNKIFEQVLQDEQANLDDLVVSISGSGDSDNVVEATEYCNSRNIPNISFSGFDGGKIAKTSQKPIIAVIHDQQISEDVMQALLHMSVKYAKILCDNGDSKTDRFKEYQESYVAEIQEGLGRLSEDFLDEVIDNVAHTFIDGRQVYLIAPEGNGASISAEHTAHNLNWDAVYGVDSPPARNIVSTPTNSNYSGIGNDRVAEGIVSIQQLENAQEGDLMLLFAYDSNSATVRNTVEEARKRGVETYVVCGRGQADVCFGNDDQYVTADLLQMTGHMVGRIARYKLKEKLGQDIETTVSEYLINEDLANRRLLNEREGL